MLNTHSISFRLAVTIVAILLLLSAVAAVYFPYRQQVTMTDEFIHETRTLSEAAAMTIGVGLSNDDLSSLSQIAEWLRSYEQLEHLIITDNNGEIIATFPDDDIRTKSHILLDANFDNSASVVRSSPIHVDDKLFGQIIISRSLDAIHATVRQSRSTILILALIVVLLSVPAAYLMGATIVRPLRRLSNTTANVARGDYRLIRQIDSKDEIGALAEHFNAMILQISKQTSELVKSNELLVDEIAHRERAEQHIKQSLGEKEILLKEIHHRVKNNLQVITSLLNLQSRRIDDEATLRMFSQSQNRVKAMALIHEQLYQTEELSSIDFAKYAAQLTKRLKQSFDKVCENVTISVDIDDIFLGIDTAVPCGLIVNELISNCLKYAFPNGAEGEIRLKMVHEIESKEYVLSVADNGIGISDTVDIKNTSSLGMQLVHTLTNQMRGRMDVEAEGGTTFTVTFPAPDKTSGEQEQWTNQKSSSSKTKVLSH